MKKSLLVIALAILFGWMGWELLKIFWPKPQRALTDAYWIYVLPASETEFNLACLAMDVNGRFWPEPDFSKCQGGHELSIITSQPAREVLEDCPASGISGTCPEPHPMLKLLIESEGQERPYLED
jgi:hypothetical protein